MKMNPSRLVSSFAVRLSMAAVITLMGISLLGNASSHPQDQRNFWVLNNTGKTISRLYVSPHERGSWGSDVLGETQLPNGLGTLISFNSDIRTSCTMDFKLVFRDGSEQTYLQGRNVCALAAVQFNRSDSIGLRF